MLRKKVTFYHEIIPQEDTMYSYLPYVTYFSNYLLPTDFFVYIFFNIENHEKFVVL